MAYKTATLTQASPTATLVADADTILFQTYGYYGGDNCILYFELSRTGDNGTWSPIVFASDTWPTMKISSCALAATVPSGWSVKVTLRNPTSLSNITFEMV